MYKKLLLPAGALSILLFSISAHAQPMLYGVTASNSIFTMSNVTSPSSINGPYSVSGVATGQTLTAIDTRAGNGRLYVLGYDSTTGGAQLYWLSQSGNTYTANAIGRTTTAMNLGTTNNISFDFIPTTGNQIPIISSNGNNYILNANNGTVTSTGINTISYANSDLYASASNALAATAYSYSFLGSDTTTKFGYNATPTQAGMVGYSIPVKDTAMYRSPVSPSSTFVNSVSSGSKVVMYPNPVLSQAKIILSELPKTAVAVYVIDLNGNIVRTFKYEPGNYSLDVDMSKLPAGIYSVRVQQKDIPYYTNIKVVKEE